MEGTEVIEGSIILRYCDNCDDFINIMLKNGYQLTMNLTDDSRKLAVYYLKDKEEE